MTSLLRPLAIVAAVVALASCAPVPPPPAPYAGPPPAPYAAPPPAYVPAPIVRGCGPGRHWVPRHRTRSGRLIRGHCAWNR